jgi:tripartite-type tricarboxylate transporter receptor subunit TctC
MKIGIFGFIALVLLAALFPAEAQVYPSRDLRVVVGLPAGSGGDVTARFYADKLAQVLNKPVIVENRPGMILSIGADVVAKSAPDGYTILITSVSSSHAANLFNFKKLPYDPIKDFTPVGRVELRHRYEITHCNKQQVFFAALNPSAEPVPIIRAEPIGFDSAT